MTVTLELDDRTAARLQSAAERAGVGVEEYIKRLIEPLPPLPEGVKPAASLRELFAEWEAEDATDDPAEIARRQQEWEELKRGLNEARTSDRKLFP